MLTIFPAKAYHPLTLASKFCKCSGCGEVFKTVKGFEAHRRDRQCLDPRTINFVFVDGAWKKNDEEN
jgi:hypothetical protein